MSSRRPKKSQKSKLLDVNLPIYVLHSQIGVCGLGRVQAEGDKSKTPKFGKLFGLLTTFEIVLSQFQKSLVHSRVIVVRTGCHSQILLITPNLRLTAVFITFDLGP